MDCTCQAPLSVGFRRQEYWSGLLFPSPGDLFNPGTELVSPVLTGGFFTTEPPGKPPLSIQGSEMIYGISGARCPQGCGTRRKSPQETHQKVTSQLIKARQLCPPQKQSIINTGNLQTSLNPARKS